MLSVRLAEPLNRHVLFRCDWPRARKAAAAACLRTHAVEAVLEAGNKIFASSGQVYASRLQSVPLGLRGVAEGELPRHQGYAVDLRLQPPPRQSNAALFLLRVLVSPVEEDTGWTRVLFCSL